MSFYVAAHWRSREETIESIGTGIERCLRQVCVVDDRVSDWRSTPLGWTAGRIWRDRLGAELLVASANDSGQDINDPFGFAVMLSSAAVPRGRLSLTVQLARVGRIHNTCLISFDHTHDISFASDVASCLELLAACVEPWHADVGVASSTDLNRGQRLDGYPRVGWITYVRSNPDRFDEALTAVRPRQWLGGMAIVLAPELELVAAASCVDLRCRLRDLGLLTPLS